MGCDWLGHGVMFVHFGICLDHPADPVADGFLVAADLVAASGRQTPVELVVVAQKVKPVRAVVKTGLVWHGGILSGAGGVAAVS